MTDDIIKIPYDEVKSIEWEDNHIDYDLQLYRLGNNYGKFMVINPWLEDDTLKDYIEYIPSTNKCIVWQYQGNWVAKMFNGYWTPEIGYEHIEIDKPKLLWSRNPDIDKALRYENDPYGNFEPAPWDSSYELIWYLDPKVNPTPDKIWAMSCKPIGKEIKGTKDMGYIMPLINVEYNSALPELSFDIDQCYPAYWDLDKECAWELDPIHAPNNRMWVIKFTPTHRKPKDWEWYGIITPENHIEYNPNLPQMDYDIDYVIPWHDLGYENVWMLDKKHLTNNEDDMWAIKIKATANVTGAKIIDYISPLSNIEYNPDMPKIEYDIDYAIPWHDLAYEHVWYINDQFNTWILKIRTSKKIKGSKHMHIPNPDVVFISYNEPNAEENWQRVLEKVPKAMRVDGVKGIFNAHKAAAKLVKTDMFYVVDGDAYLTDDFQFDYQPSPYDRKCTHIWQAKNPINGLVYGYGGVKLFSTKVMRKTRFWDTLDLSTTVIDQVKLIDKISNITAFDTDPKSVWRSTFRECVKLSYNTLLDNKDRESQVRLDKWLKGNESHKFNKYTQDAALHAIDWVNKNKDNFNVLQMINSREWLEEQFATRKFDMDQKYIRLEHSNLEHKNWFVVNWCLGSTCNYACSYCPKDLHDGLKGWPDPDVIKNFILRVKATHPDKKLYFEFTGGEVTLYKHFIDICKFCTEHGVKVGLISNGSRTIRYWEENKQYFDHVCLSYHPEFAEEKHFVEVAKVLHDDVRTHVNIMMSPEKFDHCYAVANKVKNIGNVSMALQPLIHDFGDTLYDYNDFQKKIFDKQHELITKHIKFTKTFDYYRGAMRKVDAAGIGQVSSAHRFISEKTNDWSGWKCYAGVEQLIVDMDGRIFRGWCKVGAELGHIADKDLNLSIEPIVCHKTMCHCNFDIMSTKEL